MNEEALSALIGPVVTPLGLEIDSIEIRKSSGRPLLRVRLDGDGPEGLGPTMDQIAGAAKLVSRALDAAPKITGDRPYTLEVSSRGTDRPLTAPAHYRRNRGRLVACELRDGTTVTGRVVDADDVRVRLDEAGELAYADIVRAVVQVELKRAGRDEDAAAGDEEEW